MELFKKFWKPRLNSKKIEEIEETLNHVKSLADIINTTLDREEFVKALEEIKAELKYLSCFERCNIFYNSTPSKDLERLIENEHLTWEKFEKRYSEANRAKEKINYFKSKDSIQLNRPKYKRQKSFDVEKYAIMCNAYLEHQDEMEQCKND